MAKEHPLEGSERVPDEDDPEFAERYPNLASQRDMDRQEHVRRAREMGATREQASRHADEEAGPPRKERGTAL